MKKIILHLLLVSFSLILFTSGFNQAYNSEIAGFGVIKHNGQKVSGVSVKVFEGKKLIKSVVTTRFRGYGFTLKFNSNYRIVISKLGFLKQEILINTHVSDEVISYSDRLLWEPDFVIHKIMPGLDIDQFEQPISSYVFDEEYWGFTEDKIYKQKITPEITEVAQKLNELQVVAYQAEKVTGDSLFKNENYPEAIMAFNMAQEFNPEDKSLKKKIKTAKKLMKKQQSTEDAYQESINTADNLLANEEYDEANTQYQKALVFKPDAIYPLNKIYEIDSIQSYAWIAKNDEFDLLLANADSLMEQVELKIARERYSDALLIFPKKPYPIRMMQTVDSLIRIEESLATITPSNDNLINKMKESLAFEDSITINSVIAKPNSDDTKEDALTPEPEPDSETVDPITSAEQSLSTETEALKPVIENEESTEKAEEPIEETHPTEIPAPPVVEEPQPTYTPVEPDEEITKDMPEVNLDSLAEIAHAETDAEESLQKLKKALVTKVDAGDKKAEADILDEIGMVYQSEFKLDKALNSYTRSLEIKQELGDKLGEIEAHSNIASVMYDSGSYNTAIQQFEESLSISEEIENKEQSSEILQSIATVLENTYRYDEAIEKLQKSLEIKEELGDEEAVSDVQKNIGKIYYEQNNFDEAIEALEKTASIEAKLQNKNDLSATYNSIGAAYYNKNDYTRSLEYYEKSLEQSRAINDKKLQSLTLNNLGNVNYGAKKFNEAIEYYQKSLALKNEISFKEGIAATLHNIGNSYFKLKDYDSALKYYNLSQDAAEETKQFEVMWRNYLAFAKTYYAIGKYKIAYENYRKYTTSKFEEYGSSDQLIELQEQYESSKIAVRTLKRELQKQSRIARYESERNRREMQIVELEIENQRQQLKKQRNVILFSIVGFIVILAFSLLVTKQYQLTKKAYRIVNKQKQDITKGISYAARIQSAVLPPTKYIESTLPEHFILYKPCEVVSGDFYWVGTHFGKTVIAVSDCTGHGVPGGFMSMLGVALLNEIMTSDTPLETHEVLTQLRDRIVEALHQQGGDSESLDGMDISLLMFDPKTREIQFSAAYHTMYLISNGELNKIKGDRVPIGYHHKIKPFTSQKEQLRDGDVIYMTTDGYSDQLGEKTQSRFMLGPFRELLVEIHEKPFAEQKEILDTNIENWKGSLPQTDDMLVFGMKV